MHNLNTFSWATVISPKNNQLAFKIIYYSVFNFQFLAKLTVSKRTFIKKNDKMLDWEWYTFLILPCIYMDSSRENGYQNKYVPIIDYNEFESIWDLLILLKLKFFLLKVL